MKKLAAALLTLSILILSGCGQAEDPGNSSSETGSRNSVSTSSTDSSSSSDQSGDSQSLSSQPQNQDDTEFTNSTTGQASSAVSSKSAEKPPSEEPQSHVFQNGINFHAIMSSTEPGFDNYAFNKEYYLLVKQAGFDHIRLPINVLDFTDGTAPDYTISASVLNKIDTAINCALDAGLVLVLDMHGGLGELWDEFARNEEKFFKCWEQLAIRYQKFPDRLYFEIMNEPRADSDARDPISLKRMNSLQMRTIEMIRQYNPTRKIVAAVWNMNVTYYLYHTEIPLEDPNIIMSIHEYAPMGFTHQAYPGSGRPPATAETGMGFDYLSNIAKQLREYTERTGRMVWLSEWGVYQGGGLDPALTAKYIKFFAAELRKNGIPNAYWEFNQGFGLYDSKTNAWKQSLLDALDLG